ncbi:MAG TPA: nickel-dependent hydrogenase large subunit [Spirochaetota bacterium]|nr:nickel-dependent hydrogenase large subunit [Spirochaetota bacterium]HOM86845.1 nickel-dependent hydrogenase large subunit [Spirochaetota bacterium]HOR92362.1 nickel-dependent hydrogenase large subunit [Spirochaetota bacterium]HOT18456.1 nickel-dependent hydrogenase large subunit [Spirochaetota bacterium]HPD03787.1 nickel-dependent hydrogenase large subunit [Spirochaetota bacterium]
MKSDRVYPLNIGPIHPAFKEPIKFTFRIEGEQVTGVDIDFGYTHRGIEKIALERNYIQIIYLLERVCGICSFSHPLAYCLAIEDVAEIQVPDRARYIRTIIGEMERLHSHLLWTGVAAHEIGFDTLFMYTWNIREKVLDCLEELTGNRINYGMLTIGGVRRDVTPENSETITRMLEYYMELYDRASEILLDDLTLRARTEGIGILSREQAEMFCAVGPTARGSGLLKDVRIDYPVNAYYDIPWLNPISPRDLGKEPIGDVYDRMAVRVLEIKQSLNIIQFCMENLPEGDIHSGDGAVKIINTLKKLEGEGIGRYEAPRGEVCHYVILDNQEHPIQLKVKAPTYSNGFTWIPMLTNIEIADIPIVIASIDPCVACADRMTFIRKGGDEERYNWEYLHQKSIKKYKRSVNQ